MTASRDRRAVTTLQLVVSLLVGALVLAAAPAASADTGGRGFYIPGAFAPVSAGQSLTFRAYMDDYTPVPRIVIDPADVGVCRIAGYDTRTWNLTVEMLAGGTCTVWYQYSPGVEARSEIPVDPRRYQQVVVEGLAASVPLSAGQTAFTAYAGGERGPLDVVEVVTDPGAPERCRFLGYDRSTFQVRLQVLRGPSCRVRLARAGSDAFHASERVVDVVVDDPQGEQRLTWSPPAQVPAWGDTPVRLDGVSSSGLPLTYTSSTPSLCTVDGDQLRVVDAGGLLPSLYGSCTVTASQPGDDRWHAAAPVTRTIELRPSPREQTVSWTWDPYRYFGPSGGSRTLTGASASSGRPLVYESRTPQWCTVAGDVVTTVSVTYTEVTCVVRAIAPGAYGSWWEAHADVEIPMLPSTRPPEFYTDQLQFPAIGDHEIVLGPFEVEAKGALPVAVYTQSPDVCTVQGRTVTPQAVGTCELRAIQSQNQYQQAVAKDQSFQITRGRHDISFPALAERPVDSEPFSVSAATTSGSPVTFASTTSEVCAVNGHVVTLLAAGDCVVRASAGDATWDDREVERTFAVTALPQTIELADLADVARSEQTVPVDAVSSRDLPVTLDATTPEVCTVADGTVTLVGSGTCTVRATQPGTARVASAPAVSRSFTVWPTPAVPATTRRTQVVSLLGQGESALRVGRTTESCRAVGADLVMVAPGRCRAVLTDADGDVVRRVSSDVTTRVPDALTRQLERLATVEFARGSSTLSSSARRALKAQAVQLADSRLVVVHGSRRTSERSSLAAARARTVAAHLDRLGVSAEVVPVGLAATAPARAELFTLR